MNPNLQILLQLEELALVARGLELVGGGVETPGNESTEKKIQKLRRRLPGHVLSIYDHLTQQYPDVVTVIVDGICQGCRQSVSGRLVAQAARANSIVQCEHCGRFIVAEQNVPDYVS